jgi:hypothetical protein
LRIRVAPAESCQATRTFASDQSTQAFVDQSRPLFHSSNATSVVEQFLIEIDRRSHDA